MTGGGGAPGGLVPGPAGCGPVRVENGVDLSGYQVDRYTWSDATCAERKASLVRNSGADPGGSNGGYLRQLVWSAGGTTRTATGSGANGWMGWGYVVNHYGSTADLSKSRPGTSRTVFAGQHHAIHEFKLRMNPGGPVDVTIHWFFASGRSAPVYAITFDATPAGPNAVDADTRAPYGDLDFEGSHGPIGGIGWGDKYRFVTQGAGPLSESSAWNYAQPNLVPYVQMWSQSVDAEMGAVQTESFERHVAGGDYGDRALESCWGKTDSSAGPGCTSDLGTLPTSWLWPFQLNQYELPYGSTSHRLAWGSSYGAVGQQSVSAFGESFAGYPRVSYAVFMVVGPKTPSSTLAQVTEVEHLGGAQLTASVGAVITQGPAGVGRTDTVTYAPPGYSPLYATWELEAASGAVTAVLDPMSGALSSPTFHITGFTKDRATVSLGGRVLTATQAFVSIDGAKDELWVTLNGRVTGPVSMHVE